MSPRTLLACGLTTAFLPLAAALAQTSTPATAPAPAPLIGENIDRTQMRNRYGHIPAQCYIETAEGAQNPCQYCHTDGLAKRRFGNNVPQNGHSGFLGAITEEYAFAALSYPFEPNGSINPWENTYDPAKLRAFAESLNYGPTLAQIEARLKDDNWSPAYAQRPGDPKAWDAGVEHPLRLFPGLDPADLPAQEDGFVRSAKTENGFFHDERGHVTGWRAINFTPYGIFTPLTGSVSGIYIRLPETFMKDAQGRHDLAVYARNLDLLANAIGDRLTETHPKSYHGAASTTPVQPGLYPLGTEFAHPLHYVDVSADGTASKFPGARANRVKEIRYMYKIRRFDPEYGAPEMKEESSPIYAHRAQGWADNGAGWILAGYIEDAKGALRPQTPAELTQCVGCHSGSMPQPDMGGYGLFQSGVGVTVDSTWAMARKHQGAEGWREMDAMGYRAQGDEIGRASRGDPLNRGLGVGEFAHFLQTVVGVSLYGDMPESVETFLGGAITRAAGYSADWPALDVSSAAPYLAAQKLRAQLLRELTYKGGHLDAFGALKGALLYPPRRQALEGARSYGIVVATQRYDLGKDVFPKTPVTLRYLRARDHYGHQDGRPYAQGEVVIDRPIDTNPTSLTYGIGTAPTQIDSSPNFEPFLDPAAPAARRE